MYDFNFRWLWSPHHFTGLLEDYRSPLAKREDFKHEERVLGSVPTFNNQIILTSPYSYENQLGTSECVTHAVGLGLAIERKNDTGTYVRLAPTFPYRLRNTYPQPGCVPQNIFDLYRKYGAPLATTLPTPASEYEANNAVLTAQMYTEAEIFKGKDYYMVNNAQDINTLAEVAQRGHGVPITIFGTGEEWGQTWVHVSKPTLKYEDAEIQHEVCVLPQSSFMKDGKRYIAVQDSAWFGSYKLRYVSEDFIAIRCYGAGYWDTVSVLSTGVRPKYTFTKVLQVGAVGAEVKMLQTLLVAEGLLPADCQTGNFYGRTLAGVNAFQNKYASDILVPLHLDRPTGVWGSASIAKANVLCA